MLDSRYRPRGAAPGAGEKHGAVMAFGAHGQRRAGTTGAIPISSTTHSPVTGHQFHDERLTEPMKAKANRWEQRARGSALGLTLIEVMIVVAVVAALAMVAYPSYDAYMVRSKLVEATTGLSDYRVRLEQYWQDNRNYGTASSALCGTSATVPALPTSKHFTFSCAVPANNQQYTATATSKAGAGLGSSAGAYAYTINQNNVRTTTAFPGATVPASCWLAKKGDSC